MDFSTFWLIKVVLFVLLPFNEGHRCGYPGVPSHGNIRQRKDLYDVGQAVTYFCDDKYYLLGYPTRKCLANGTWSGIIPVCDISLSLTNAVASASLHTASYPPKLAIDGNKGTCTYISPQLQQWWRLDLGDTYRINSVAVTLSGIYGDRTNQHLFTIYVVSVDSGAATFHPCSPFRGTLASQTLKLTCDESNGIAGQYIHIEDRRKSTEYFGICEVEVFVKRNQIECGDPERPYQSYIVNVDKKQVEYQCVFGYSLLGPKRRQCLKNGRWSETQPICQEILCKDLDPIEDGNIHLAKQQSKRLLPGSVATYSCKTGYVLSGNDTRQCTQNGTWTESAPSCKPINCGSPPTIFGGSYLSNGTNVGSVAELQCDDGFKPTGISMVMWCQDDGQWSTRHAICSQQSKSELLGLKMKQPKDSDDAEQNDGISSAGFVIGITAVVLFLVVLLVTIYILRRKGVLHLRQFSKSPTDSSVTVETFKLDDTYYQRDPFYSDVYNNKSWQKKRENPSDRRSSYMSSTSSPEDIYEEVKPQVNKPNNIHMPNERPRISDLYAKVDFAQKRNRKKKLPTSTSCSVERDDSPESSSLQLRELPPIPKEGPDVPSKHLHGDDSPSILLDNAIYNSSGADYMVENTLYSTKVDLH